MGITRYQFLLVDDSEDIRLLVARALRMIPHDLTWVMTAEEGRAAVAAKKFDFVLLDVELPDGDGYTLCHHVVQALPDVPIFFVTGRNSAIDLLAGFSMGAEDFINKPFRPYEFRARVIARLQKSFRLIGRDFLIETAGLCVNQTRKLAFAGGVEISLTPPEAAVLGHFICNPDRAITEDSLGFAALSAGGAGKDISVASHVKSLRKKLGVYGSFLVSETDGTYSFKPVPIAGGKMPAA
ncbi:MAG: response regulator transcription factor [Bdellovibrionota bacterium]